MRVVRRGNKSCRGECHDRRGRLWLVFIRAVPLLQKIDLASQNNPHTPPGADTTLLASLFEDMMMQSREGVVNYMDPLGLNMIFGYDNHYGPGPWIDYSPHPDWNSTYYHRADSLGVGFDRTESGSDAVS